MRRNEQYRTAAIFDAMSGVIRPLKASNCAAVMLEIDSKPILLIPQRLKNEVPHHNTSR
ncbi:hypothetical protein [secondary endosymbiont of Ctenarytaina eucalypti]|uniref:Uncharacterized protein n=1 Tax=secondary endosymbiont of Ctenarytaina eucalypti TaxID=1199245 RepID=J3YSL1_9ENTR|nr:hypothetical protein [secondary endosymbiont of Ctenarytaina eucalypti]AFP85273.1 hypothetical protein A359_09070 [secondary endosymbiont of Ctenarytaina eucalypti]